MKALLQCSLHSQVIYFEKTERGNRTRCPVCVDAQQHLRYRRHLDEAIREVVLAASGGKIKDPERTEKAWKHARGLSTMIGES